MYNKTPKKDSSEQIQQQQQQDENRLNKAFKDYKNIFRNKPEQYLEFQDISKSLAKLLCDNGVRLVVFSFENVLVGINFDCPWIYDSKLLVDYSRPCYIAFMVALLLECDKMFIGITSQQEAQVIKGFMEEVFKKPFYE